MIKKVVLLALVVCLILGALIPGPVQAQGELTVINNSSQADFPFALTFYLSAQSNADITDVRLHYAVGRIGFAQITSEVYLEFEPDTMVEVGWALEMVRIGGLPPGSGLDYWWTVADAAGAEVETAPVHIDFDDNRYSWQSISEDKITIYWYEGKQSFAQEIMTTAQEALSRLNMDTGAYLEKPVAIYVYPDSDDLRGAMIHPQEWTGGVAFTRFGIIAIGISMDNIDWGKLAIAHELTHLVIYQMILNPYSGIPTWLDEGLAMHTEGALLPVYENYLAVAIIEDSLISVRSLSSPFSAYTDEATLSYAESYSLVDFLISSYGQDKMLELLNAFRQGSTYDDALEQVYGFDMDGLDARWRDYIKAPARSVDSVGLVPLLVGSSTFAQGQPIFQASSL